MKEEEKRDLLEQIIENNQSIVYFASRMMSALEAMAYSLAARRVADSTDDLVSCKVFADFRTHIRKREEPTFTRNDFYEFALDALDIYDNASNRGIDTFYMWFENFLKMDFFFEYDFNEAGPVYKFYPEAKK